MFRMLTGTQITSYIYGVENAYLGYQVRSTSQSIHLVRPWVSPLQESIEMKRQMEKHSRPWSARLQKTAKSAALRAFP